MNIKVPCTIIIGILSVLICLISSPAWPVNLPTQHILPLELATKAAITAIKKCSADGFRVSVTIVDQAGLIKTQLRADGAGPHTLDSSRRKAYTAASLQDSTQQFAALIAKNPELKSLTRMNEHILFLGGGFPIKIAGETVGAVGVGGAPGTKHDEACAKAALKVLDVDDLFEK